MPRLLTSALGITVDDNGDRLTFGNDDGTWTIWKAVTGDGLGRVVGPGYIGRATMRNGQRLCEGFVAPTVSVNDPRWQGIGGFACHHFRANGEPDIWNRGWEMKAHGQANLADPFGIISSTTVVAPYEVASGADAGKVRASFVVDFADRYSYPTPLLTLRYDYTFEKSGVKMWVTVRQGFPLGMPAAFIKEPKLALGLAPANADGFRPHTLDIAAADDTLLRRIDLLNEPKLQNPAAGTVQVGFDARCRARFFSDSVSLNVVARASAPLVYDPMTGRVTDYKAATRDDWEGAADGFDRWAQLANGREVFETQPCSDYCLQGPPDGTTLTRQWEVAKRGTEPMVELMLHAWEGGSGLPDCLCCARRYAENESFTAYLSVSRDAGWAL